jgi:hypothetical protein
MGHSVREETVIRHLISQLQQQALAALAASAAGDEPPELQALRVEIEELKQRNDPDYEPVLQRKQQRLEQLLSAQRSDPALLQKLADPRWFDLLPYEELTTLLQQLVVSWCRS